MNSRIRHNNTVSIQEVEFKCSIRSSQPNCALYYLLAFGSILTLRCSVIVLTISISVDPEEVEILRAAQVIDQHLLLKPSEPTPPDSEF